MPLKVIERVDARYDIQELELGKVYKWRPESLLIQCECGQRTTLTPSDTTCEECAKEHIDLLGEALRDQRELRRRLREEDSTPDAILRIVKKRKIRSYGCSQLTLSRDHYCPRESSR